MLTNVFRLGGFQQISWFQLIPAAGDGAQAFEKWQTDKHADALANKVLNAHTKLQNEGHLSSWTCDSSGSFEDVKVKLWIFIPGRNESISTTVQPAISGLKVVGSGFWCFSKDYGEVPTAFCQALRNRMERALRSVGYMRFGDVFVKCRSFASDEPQLRKPLPTCEPIFTASEEAFFVHFLLQRKRFRALSTHDMQAALKLHHDGSADNAQRQAVVVAPHGLSGELSGCCSGDLVHQLHESKLKAVDGELATDGPLHLVSSCYHGRSSTYGLHAEVYFGHASKLNLAALQGTKISNTSRSLDSEQTVVKNAMLPSDREDRPCPNGNHLVEKLLLYPHEAVLFPFVPIVPPRIYLKRCWMQRWLGTTWMEDDLQVGFTAASSCSSWGRVRKTSSHEMLDGVLTSTNASCGIKTPNSKSSSSSSSSSGRSSIENSSSHGSSSSSDSDAEAGVGPGELEADAESLVIKENMNVGFKQAQVSAGQPTDEGLDEMKGFEDIMGSSKWGRSGGAPQGEVPVLKTMRKNSNSGGEVSHEVSRSMQNRTDGIGSGMGLSPNVGVGTPKAASSQVGTPWDWPDDDRGISMGIENDADILAEFGDFGDFFEDEGLGFGEPPGTAESQAMMFPLTDCVEGITSPGISCLDFQDPLLLPILDIPVLEGLGQQPVFSKDEKIGGFLLGFQKDFQKSPEALPDSQNTALDSLPKLEAMVLFAPGYDPVSFPSPQGMFQNSIFKSPYLPKARKLQMDVSGASDYVYGATPPPSPKVEVSGRKRELYETICDRELNTKRVKGGGGVNYMKGKSFPTSHAVPGRVTSSLLGGNTSLKGSTWAEIKGYTYREKAADHNILNSPRIMLATDLECYRLQLFLIQCRDTHFCGSLSSVSLRKDPVRSSRESVSDAVHTADSSPHAKTGSKQHQERKKKDRIPSRIAGDIDEEIHDSPRVSQIGVWRPVGTPKPQRASHTPWNDNSSVVTLTESSSLLNQKNATLTARLNHWQELLEAIPFLVQQGSVSFDAAFDGDCGDGPFGWLMSQEQERRKSVCGPGMSHAGCGGMLCASHFLDNAGVELLDPMANEMSAASVAAILQSDIRVAMGTAFGDAHLDGPLSLGEWLRGRPLLGDSFFSESLPSDSKETASTITVAIGEPITPPQCTTAPPSGLKASAQDIESQACDGHRSNNSWTMEGSSLSDDGCNRRCGQDTGSIESDTQPSSSRGGPTVVALPMPSLLVGYQDDWLKVSSSTLHLWEKAPFEPYATAKPVTYYVVCPRIESLLCATADYLQQLSAVYEACRLGTHVAGNMAFGQTGFPATTGKHAFSGFMAIDFPSQASLAHPHSNVANLLSEYATSISKSWNIHEFRKALRKACKALPLCSSSMVQREPENGPCLVYYVICPSSDPDAILQTMIDACQSIGHNVAMSDKERRSTVCNQTHRAFVPPGSVEDSSTVPGQGVVGFSTPKLVLQVLTAEIILKSSSPISAEVDSLKEVAFTIYNKIRRIPRTCSSSDYSLHTTPVGRSRSVALQTSTAMPGMWKDCSPGRSSGGASTALLGQDSLLESSSFRSNSWDNPWQQPGSTSDVSFSPGIDGQIALDTPRYLFEPLFILAEPGTLEHGVGFSASRSPGFDEASGNPHLGLPDTITGTVADGGSEFDIAGGGTQRVVNLHCCYGWTEDCQWLISVWTDSRGELLDVHLFPMACVSGRRDGKGLHSLFAQVLLHGCQLLLMATGTGTAKSRAIVITRIGAFYELECQEWRKAVLTVGGADLRKWPVQIWHQSSDSTNIGGSSSSLQPQDVNTLSERTLTLANTMPSSPGPSSSLFTSRSKTSNFVKNEMGSNVTRKQGGGGHVQNDICRGAFQLVHSISFVSVMLEHSLQITGLNDIGSQSGGSQNSLSSSTWVGSNSANVLSTLGTGFGLVKTLASTAASYLFVPAHGLRFISNLPLQLPMGCISESPVIEQILQKSGLASTIASAFIVSRATPSIRTESAQRSIKDWPATLLVSLVGHMGNSPNLNTQQGSNTILGSDAMLKTKGVKSVQSEGCDQAAHAQMVLEMLSAELQALSWLTVSPVFPLRRTALPFHCGVVQRLRRLLHYANNEFGGLQD